MDSPQSHCATQTSSFCLSVTSFDGKRHLVRQNSEPSRRDSSFGHQSFTGLSAGWLAFPQSMHFALLKAILHLFNICSVIKMFSPMTRWKRGFSRLVPSHVRIFDLQLMNHSVQAGRPPAEQEQHSPILWLHGVSHLCTDATVTAAFEQWGGRVLRRLVDPVTLVDNGQALVILDSPEKVIRPCLASWVENAEH